MPERLALLVSVLLVAGCASGGDQPRASGVGRSTAPSARSTVASGGQAARSSRIVVPNPAKRSDSIDLRFMAPYLTDNNLDAYVVEFHGPGGASCAETVTRQNGTAWNARYSSRHRHHPTTINLGSGDWCPGQYHGVIYFDDAPSGQRRGHHHSLSCDREQIAAGVCKTTRRTVRRFNFVVN